MNKFKTRQLNRGALLAYFTEEFRLKCVVQKPVVPELSESLGVR